MLYGTNPTIKTESGDLSGFRFSIPNPKKTAIVRVPMNDELVEYLKPRKDKPDYKAELKLFNNIRQDKGEAFDEYEAYFVIERMMKADVAGTTPEDDGTYTVKLKTPFGEVSHNVMLPTQKTYMDIRRNFGAEKLRSMYDECQPSAEGYAGDVPPHHKQAVAAELMVIVNQIDTSLEDPNA